MSLDAVKLENQWQNFDSAIARDLKLNFKKFALDSSLTPAEAALVTLAVANAVGADSLMEWARDSLRSLGTDPSHVAEAEESAAMMGMLNSYYKFRSFITKTGTQEYTQAGLRMTALARPLLGKELFELLALSVSVVNGCETCVVSHEKVLRDGGMDTQKIHDAVRLSATIKGLAHLKS